MYKFVNPDQFQPLAEDIYFVNETQILKLNHLNIVFCMFIQSSLSACFFCFLSKMTLSMKTSLKSNEF